MNHYEQDTFLSSLGTKILQQRQEYIEGWGSLPTPTLCTQIVVCVCMCVLHCYDWIVLFCLQSDCVFILRLALSTYEASLDGGPDDMTVVDAATLRRQVSILHPQYLFCGMRADLRTILTEDTFLLFTTYSSSS